MIKRIIPIICGVVLVSIAGVGAIVWFTCRIYVPENKCAVLIKKTGTPPANGQPVATEPGQKGIQEEVLGPGRHFFYDPIRWEWRLVDLIEIPAGKPDTWEWPFSLSAEQREQLRTGAFRFKGKFPMIGVVTRKVGTNPPAGQIIVDRDSGNKGILREVLTPGTYKINPEVYDVELYPAAVIPAGFVGVVTNLFAQPGAQPLEGTADSHVATAAPPPPSGELAGDAQALAEIEFNVRPLAKPGERGTLKDVLQPGVYFINPKLQKVTLIEVGYNEYSQLKVAEGRNYRISFPSDTGYDIRVGVTVVWGIHPAHAAEIINEFGNIDRVLDKVINPQLRSICRNTGSTYAARDFIQGEKREMFQRDLTNELRRVCRTKHVEVLLALVREIEVHAPKTGLESGEVTEDLKRTIQQSHIAIEKQITKAKQREAAMVKAKLEEEQKKIDIAEEIVRADTRVMVANIAAEAEKDAATIDAEAGLEVAQIQEEVAKLDARRTEILGTARANVEKMKKQAEADGYRLLVEAFGSPQAFNLYTFAENFEPESIRFFYAGDGTFWTDLTRFEELGAAKLLETK